MMLGRRRVRVRQPWTGPGGRDGAPGTDRRWPRSRQPTASNTVAAVPLCRRPRSMLGLGYGAAQLLCEGAGARSRGPAAAAARTRVPEPVHLVLVLAEKLGEQLR